MPSARFKITSKLQIFQFDLFEQIYIKSYGILIYQQTFKR